MGFGGVEARAAQMPKSVRENTNIWGAAVNWAVSPPWGRRDPRAGLGAGCSPRWTQLHMNHPNRGLATHPFVTRVCKLLAVQERCRIPAPTRQRGPRPLGGTLGEVALQHGAAPGAEHPSGTWGLVGTAMALRSHRQWPRCCAPGLAASQHPRHPHCPNWVSPKRGTRPPCLIRCLSHAGDTTKGGAGSKL